MARAPTFITFTGADSFSDLAEMGRLSETYPIEWGILISKKRQGVDNRYPPIEKVMQFSNAGLPIAGHICGEYADEIMDFKFPVNVSGFHRVQINHSKPSIPAAQRFSQVMQRRCILQHRAEEDFPAAYDMDWLYDVSGGRGVRPTYTPRNDGRLLGYAGGINAKNVTDTISRINGLLGSKGPFWLDMESGVRDEQDRFDLGKVREICELVYGPGPDARTN